MSVTIEYRGMQATINGGEWTSENDALAAFLTAQLLGVDIPASEPFPDYIVAQDIVARFSAVIIDVVKPNTEPNRIY